MTDSVGSSLLAYLWQDAVADDMSEAERLVYRSNLLGSDMRVTNYGGGNTSSKIVQTDPLTGKEVEVLWVKGSGGDLGTIKADGFSTLYMDKLTALQGLYRGLSYEDEMVGYLPHCTFNLNPRAVRTRIEVKRTMRQIPCLLYTSPSPRDRTRYRMPSSA